MAQERRLGEEVDPKELLLSGIKLVIADIDDTVVVPKDKAFFKKYSDAVDDAIAIFFECDEASSKAIADFYRKNYGGGQYALFHGTSHNHFPEYGEKEPNFSVLYDAICEIDPTGQFIQNPEVASLLKTLKAQGVIVVGLTSSPSDLSRRILNDSGIDPDTHFEELIAYTRESGPPKMVLKEKIFEKILEKYRVKPEEVLSVGDNFNYEIAIPLQMGMKTAFIGEISQDERVTAYQDFLTAIMSFGKVYVK